MKAEGRVRSAEGRFRRQVLRLLPSALCALLLFACTNPPVQDDVTIQFSDDSDLVTVTAETRFEMKPANDQVRKRVDTAREAAQANADAWSMRFGRLTPESERVTLQRSRGALERVTRSVTIASDDLPRVFSDVSITMNVIRGDGWREFSIYPGTSGRATREQQRHFDEELTAWSRDVARYFAAVRHLYRYLDDNPGRAKYVFAALIAGKDEDRPPVLEDEQPLVDAVTDSMVKIAEKMDEQNARAETFAESADLIFNPFPARMTVRVPHDPISSEGFTKDLTIEPVDLLKSVASLEGKWLSPDPLAQLIQENVPTPEQLAAMPRKAEPVTSASEIATALREKLTRPRAYVVRWRD